MIFLFSEELWEEICEKEEIDFEQTNEMPSLFRVDEELNIANGYRYSLKEREHFEYVKSNKKAKTKQERKNAKVKQLIKYKQLIGYDLSSGREYIFSLRSSI